MSQAYAFNGRGYTSTVIQEQHRFSAGMMEQSAGNNRFIAWQLANPIKLFDQHSAQTFINILLRYHVTARLAYKPAYDYLTAIACLFYEDTAATHPYAKKTVQEFLTLEVIDNIEVDLMMQVERVVKHGTWNDIAIMETGSSFVVVIGEDIRIIEWCKQEGLDYQESTDRVIDLRDMFGYLTNRVDRVFGSVTAYDPNRPAKVMKMGGKVEIQSALDPHYQVMVSRLIDLKGYFTQYLTDKYDNLTDPTRLTVEEIDGIVISPRDKRILEAAGYPKVAQSEALSDVFEDVVRHYRIDAQLEMLTQGLNYEVSLDNNFKLTLRPAEDWESKYVSIEERRIKELAESLLNGDFLPEADRVLAEKYILENMN